MREKAHKVIQIDQLEYSRLWREMGKTGRWKHILMRAGIPEEAVIDSKVKEPKFPAKNVRIFLWVDHEKLGVE